MDEDEYALWYGSDEPSLTYYDSPSHNPPGIPAVGMKLPGPDGKYRCPCVCHCSFCMSGIDPDRDRRLYK